MIYKWGLPNFYFRVLCTPASCFSRYYTVDIISKLIYYGCIPDSEEDQGFCKLNVMVWGRIFCIFSICRVAVS